MSDETRITLMVWPLRHNPDEAGSAFIRAALYTTKYKHVELALSTHDYHTVLGYELLPLPPGATSRDGCVVVITTTMKHKTYMSYRTFRQGDYAIPVAVECSVKEARRMIEFAHKQIGKPYNMNLIWTILWPTAPTVHQPSWFCSQLVCCLLQQAGKLHGINASEVTTAHELVELLKEMHVRVSPPAECAVLRKL